jgi:hypothetical protein
LIASLLALVFPLQDSQPAISHSVHVSVLSRCSVQSKVQSHATT